MSDSVEYRALVATRENLVSAFKMDPQAMANSLIAKEMVPPSVSETETSELAQRLVDCVFTKVKISRAHYDTFMAVLSQHGWLNDIVEILKSTQRALSSVCPTTPGGSGPPPTQVEMEIIRSNEEEIKSLFSNLLLDVQHLLESKSVSVSDVRTFLINFFQKSDYFVTMTSFEGIFTAVSVNRLWDYQHYSPVEKLMARFLPKDHEVAGFISKYKANLSGFFSVTKIVDYIRYMDFKADDNDELPSTMKKLTPVDYKRIKVVLELDRKVTELSLEYVHNLWSSIAEDYDLPCLTAIIDKLIAGSLEVTWLVLPHIVDMITPRSKLFRRHQIIKVFVDDVIIYDAKEMATYEVILLLLCAQEEADTSQISDLLCRGADPDIHDEKGRHPLWYATANGRIDLVELLIEKRADVNLATTVTEIAGPETALSVALSKGYTVIADVLLQNGAYMDKADYERRFLVLCEEGTADISQFSDLLCHGVDPNIRDEKGRHPLWYATAKERVDLVEMLIEKRADVNLATNDEYADTALSVACDKGYTVIAEVLLRNGANVDHISKIQDDDTVLPVTPLCLACLNDDPEVVNLLLMNGAKVNKGVLQPLHGVSECGSAEIAKVLIKHGADVNLPIQDDELGATALMLACCGNRLELATVLLEAGAATCINYQENKEGLSALHLASHEGHTEMVKLLLRYHAQLEIKNNESRTPLMLASWRGHLNVVMVLLEARAAVDTQDQEGLTSLIMASKKGRFEIVEALLNFKADPNNTDKSAGWSALFFACKEGNLKMVKLLIARGAKVDIKDKNDATPFVIAELSDHQDICAELEKHTTSQSETKTEVTEDQKKQVNKSYQRLLKIFDLLEDTLLRGRKEKRSQQAAKKGTASNIIEAMQQK